MAAPLENKAFQRFRELRYAERSDIRSLDPAQTGPVCALWAARLFRSPGTCMWESAHAR